MTVRTRTFAGLIWLSLVRLAHAQDVADPNAVAPGEQAPNNLDASVPSAAPAIAPLAPEDTMVAPATTAGLETVGALSASELESLGLGTTEQRVDTSFHFWGFADFTSSQLIRPKGAVAAVQGKHQSFYVGNFNVYLSRNLSETFRMMGEVRFTYLPNGSTTIGTSSYTVQDTTSIDYANSQTSTRWGGIIIQRIYLEWTPHRLITVRAGEFLTPYGIWNVDHGSPAYIPVARPYAITVGLFPEHQTGLEVLGRWSVTNESTLGYHLTLSNGGGPIAEYKDLDRNKAVGGRLYWERYGRAYARIGVSGYYGRDTNENVAFSLTGTQINVSSKLVSQSDNLALAADALLKIGGVQLQAEWVSQQRRYTDDGRPAHAVYGGPVSTAASSDTFSWAGYLLAAYRFDWFHVTPYATMQASRLGTFSAASPDAKFASLGWTVGINFQPVDDVTLKASYAYLMALHGSDLLKDPVQALQFQLAWAF